MTVLVFRVGDIFFDRPVIIDGVSSYPDASAFKLYADCLSLVLGSTVSPQTPNVCPAIRNELVSVAVGSLFDTQEEYHLQAMSNFIMPSASDKVAYSKASGYWENAGAFFGIPFKANLTPTQIGIVLDCFRSNRRMTTTIVPLPASKIFPPVLLISASPPVIATAVNSMPSYSKKKKLEPSYAKFGYHYRQNTTFVLSMLSFVAYRNHCLTVLPSFLPCMSTLPPQGR